MNKKAITPLMASILLISFAVAVGVAVMNFGKAQVEDNATCPLTIGVKFAVIGGEDQVCFNSVTKELKFTLENGVNVPVSGLVVNVIGTNKAETFEINEVSIAKAGTYLGKVNFQGGEIRQVKISPKIDLNEGELICQEQALVAEKIRGC